MVQTDKNISGKQTHFSTLCSYIETNYKEFDLSKCPTILSFQKLGLPLHFASINNDIKLLKLLVRAGSNVHQRDDKGMSALDFLMIKVNTKLNEKKNPVNQGILKTEKAMIQYLIRKGTKFESSSLERLVQRAVQKDSHWIFKIIKSNVTGNNIKNFSFISHSVIANNRLTNKHSIVKHLINVGMPVDTLDCNGRTLLYKAVDRLDISLVTILLNNYANPISKTRLDQQTPTNLVQKKLKELLRIQSTVNNNLQIKKRTAVNIEKCNIIIAIFKSHIRSIQFGAL